VTFIAEKDPLTAQAAHRIVWLLADSKPLTKRQISWTLRDYGFSTWNAIRARRWLKAEGYVAENASGFFLTHEGRKFERLNRLGLHLVGDGERG